MTDKLDREGDATFVPPERVATVDLRGPDARRDGAIDHAAREAMHRDAETGTEAVKIGRYQLLEIVGTGGMGMVWGAWDPELERRVAVKLVRLTSRESRDRMLREGQILARLSHPNVVPIFDVGVVGEQVYLVMEWVRGTTLRAFAKAAAGWREIVGAYRQAAAGLEAAHAAGVIHRDFKPDNAIRGDDGRVRVLDFGLAHSDGTTDARVAGTPRYMAPEQARGESLGTAVDQFTFGVSLREALEGRKPPPRILATLDRSTAGDAAARFPSMSALIEALDRDPAQRWRRLALGGAAAVAAVSAFAIGKSGSPDAPAAIVPCIGGEAEIATAWNPSTHARVTAHLRALGPRGNAAGAVGGELDRFTVAWAREHRHTCLANERKELTLPRYEARLGCLERTRAQLAAVGELLLTVEADGLGSALLAAGSLPDVAACADAGSVVPPPATVAARVREIVPKVERALVRASAKRPDAIVEASAATAEARATGYLPLIARALLVEGRAAMLVDRPETRTLLAEAMTIALRVFDDVTAVEAYARWTFELARRGEKTIDHWAVMDAVAERLGTAGRFSRALLYNNRGVARLIAGDRSAARALLERALEIAGDAPEIELVVILSSLSNLASTPEASEQLARRALDRFERALGADHPETHEARFVVALVIKERARARIELASACGGLERWQQAKLFADCAYEAAWLADADGDVEDAARWMARIPDGETLPGKVAAAYLALRTGTPRAKVLADLEQLAGRKDLALWHLFVAADALVLAARATDDPARAHASWARAAKLLEQLDLVAYRRRLIRAYQVLAEHPRTPPTEARDHAQRALAWMRGTPGDEAVSSRLERLTGPGSR